MGEELLKIRELDVRAEENQILHGVSLTIGRGETHVLMGPNGAGKSTLGNVLMGNPQYRVTGGSIEFAGRDLLSQNVDERAKAGLFLSFQNPVEVPGVSLSNFIRRIHESLEVLNMDSSYADRDLNVGFSGGEKKKAEILQLLMLKPVFAILDETDSGLDVDAVRTVSRGVEEYQKDKKGTLLIITHSTRILEALHVDAVHVLVEGRIVENGDAGLISEINENGFERFLTQKAAEEG